MKRLCRQSMFRNSRKNHIRRGQHGAAMVETLLCFFVLFLVLFGMLHVSYFFIGQYFADYASLRAARSRIVGFAPYLMDREARVNAIGGSGAIVEPVLSKQSMEDSKYAVSQYQLERTLIQRYMVGSRYLEYEYWHGRSPHNDESSSSTTFHTHASSSGNFMSKVTAYFENYASVDRFIRKMFSWKEIRLQGETVLADHSQTYLE